MKTPKILVTFRNLLGSLSVVLAVSGASAAQEVIVANRSVSAASIDKSTLQNLFLGKVSQFGGSGVTLATLEDGPVHESFLQAYVGKTSQQFVSHWRKLVFSGEGMQPRAFASEQELVEFVAKTSGAIGYVSAAAAGDAVKVLSVSN